MKARGFAILVSSWMQTSSLMFVDSLAPTTTTPTTNRRGCLAQIGAGFTGMVVAGTSVHANDELPVFLRDYTKLAPLGSSQGTTEKTRGLSLEELANRLSKDLTVGATQQGGYFLSGDLSTDIFRDDAVFQDPTNRVNSLSQYQKALRILFDPNKSVVELVEPLRVDESTRTITGRIRSRGYLQLPWNPYVTAYESTIVYTVDGDGLISRQDQVWSKDASVALRESFTPSLVDPPPISHRSTPTLEPKEVTRLFEMLNGRRPYEYSQEERQEIDNLVNYVVLNQSKGEFERSQLPGKWILAYLQPGPDGAGIDRRIPFPELDFNDNFQIFGTDGSVVNVGQLFGPKITVQVYGDLGEEDPESKSIPKRLRANIRGGKLCVSQTCGGVPISGEGLFDSLYIGDRLRIGQNVNGGGARIVQIRLDDDADFFI